MLRSVDAKANVGTQLERLPAADDLAQGLRVRADELLDQFVNARRAAAAGPEIGCILGVSKHAAQQRFVALSAPQDGSMPGLMPEAAGGRRRLFFPARQARELGRRYVGPEHLVLGSSSGPMSYRAERWQNSELPRRRSASVSASGWAPGCRGRTGRGIAPPEL